MKKQLLIFAGTIITVVFVSCTKEKIETNESAIREEIAAKPGGGSGNISGNLNKGLQGLFEFNGNLAEKNGKIKDAIASTTGADIYTDDRKGNPNNAIKFTGRYGLDIFNVPWAMNMTVAAWVKYESAIPPPVSYFIKADGGTGGPTFAQDDSSYVAVISTTSISSIPSNPLDGNWHHILATYDGTNLKFYVDGNYFGSTPHINTLSYPPGFTLHYQIGFFTAQNSPDIISTWKGSMDDLRFYTRLLSASEIQSLYNL